MYLQKKCTFKRPIDVFSYCFVLFRIDSLFVSKFFSKNITGSEYQSVSCCCIPVLLEHHTLILTCDNSGKTSYWNVILQYYLFRSYIRQFDGKVSASRSGCIEQSTTRVKLDLFVCTPR